MKNICLALSIIASAALGACSETSEMQQENTASGIAAPATAENNNAASATDEQGGGKEQAKAAFKQQYPQAKEVKWGKDTNGYYEARFELGGEKYRADYTSAGEWVETESSIKFGDLPKAVQEVVKKRFDKDDITEIERVESASKGLFYDVEFKQKGKNLDIEIREDGQIIKE